MISQVCLLVWITYTTAEPTCSIFCPFGSRCEVSNDDNSCYNPPCPPVEKCVPRYHCGPTSDGGVGCIPDETQSTTDYSVPKTTLEPLPGPHCNPPCSPGWRCLQAVCAGFPCNLPPPKCFPPIKDITESTPQPPTTPRPDGLINPCAAILCLVGSKCIVVNGEGICVPGDTKCDKNEKIYPCGNVCEGKCSFVLSPVPIACDPGLCQSPNCGCDTNYYREDKSGKCVTKKQCAIAAATTLDPYMYEYSNNTTI